MVSVAFYQIIPKKAFVQILYIQSKYWKNWREMAEVLEIL